MRLAELLKDILRGPKAETSFGFVVSAALLSLLATAVVDGVLICVFK